ncbi:unnamed protein product [Arctogadus glacialis]
MSPPTPHKAALPHGGRSTGFVWPNLSHIFLLGPSDSELHARHTVLSPPPSDPKLFLVYRLSAPPKPPICPSERVSARLITRHVCGRSDFQKSLLDISACLDGDFAVEAFPSGLPC